MRRILFALAVLGRLSAQTLTGVIVDVADAVIPNAEISVLRQPSLAVVTRVRTNDVGSFRIDTLGAGVYDIKIFSPGLKARSWLESE